MNDLLKEFYTLAPGLAGFALMLAIVCGTIWGVYRLLLANSASLSSEQRLPRQITLLVTLLIGLVFLTLALPVSESTRNQIIGLIGVLLSGLIAFSSTTIVGNLMAGLMLRFTKPFKIGDFIRVESLFGRVTERGLLDTEIQTENSELISIPNTFLITHPITTTRTSGTVISATLSLGFDVHHKVIEPLLIEATKRNDLEDGFVQIMEIGDFSVTYRVSGILTEVKSLISARSRLMGHVLDTLHEANIEILSPTFMAQRPQPDGRVMIPKTPRKSRGEHAPNPEDTPESVVFDKAEQAEEADRRLRVLQEELAEQEERLANLEGDDKKQQQQRIKAIKQKIEEAKSDNKINEDSD